MHKRKAIKSAVAFLVLCTLFLVGCRKEQMGDDQIGQNKELPREYAFLDEIHEEGSKLDSVYQESVLLEYDFQMPKVENISGQAVVKVKEWQEEELEDFWKELEIRTLEADADCQERKLDSDEEKRGWGVPCIYSVNYSVFQSTEVISFLKAEYQYYSGGAHGTTSYFGMVFDSDTGERITLDDFLYGKENGRMEIAQYLIGQLEGESLWDDYQEVIIDKLTNEPEFYVEENSLVFIFDQYELASYAQGPFFLKVPLEEVAER